MVQPLLYIANILAERETPDPNNLHSITYLGLQTKPYSLYLPTPP